MTGAKYLQISEDFALNLDVVTEASAIVATRGAGKSSASAVIVEEAAKHGVQIVVFDRTGVYHGLRSDARGHAGGGLPIYILGGPHGDVPLESTAGRMIADLVVDTDHSFVLDLSDMSKSQTIHFAADFLERLYDRKARSRTTTLLVMDEAHFYAPQTPRGGFKGDSARLMGAMEDVVGLGRSRGLGVVLTTQRTQALNKAILDLIETLIIMRMLSPRARNAIKEWLGEKQEDDELGVIPSLGSLPTGAAWVWSPLRDILERVVVRRIHTYDSYRTPKPGEKQTVAAERVELDLSALGEEIRATAERAKASDPKELRNEIDKLKKKLGVAIEELDLVAGALGIGPGKYLAGELPFQVEEIRKKLTEPAREPEIIEVPTLADGELERVEKALEELSQHSTEIAGTVGELGVCLDMVREMRAEKLAEPMPVVHHPDKPVFTPPKLDPEMRAGRAPTPPQNGDLSPLAREMLQLFHAFYPAPVSPAKMGVLLAKSSDAGWVRKAMRDLVDGGYVHEDKLTEQASSDASSTSGVQYRPDAQSVQQRWRTRLKKDNVLMQQIFEVVLDAAPSSISPAEIGEKIGKNPNAGWVRKAFKQLDSLQVCVYDRRGDGSVTASPYLLDPSVP